MKVPVLLFLFAITAQAQLTTAAPAVQSACAKTAPYCSDRSQQEWDSQYPAIHAGGIERASDDAANDAASAKAALQPAFAKLTPAQHAAYTHLARAFDRFVAKDATGTALFPAPYGSPEVELPGSGLYEDEDHAAFYSQVLISLTTPPFTPTRATFRASDASLNEVYRNLLSAANLLSTDLEFSPIPSLLRQEERAWLVYRDAFAAFGRTINPRLPAIVWELPLTVARTMDLQQVCDSNGKQWIAKAHGNQPVTSASRLTSKSASTVPLVTSAAMWSFSQPLNPERTLRGK